MTLRPIELVAPDDWPARLEALLAGSGEVLAPRPAPDLLPAVGLGQPVAAPGGAVVVCTSGSTGQPRAVVLPVSALLAAAQASQAVLTRPGDWVSALPTCYVAGLMTQVRAVVAGRSWRAVAGDLSDLTDRPGPRYLSIVPTQLHRALSQSWLLRRLAGFDAILVGGARLADDLRGRAEAAGLPVVATYGMTETCGGVVYDGRPLPGVNLHLTELEPASDPTPTTAPAGARSSESAGSAPILEAGSASAPAWSVPPTVPPPPGLIGRVVIVGPTCCLGYHGRPRDSAAVIAGAAFLTSDRGSLTGDGRLRLVGRVDQVVQSGGVDVDLDSLQRHLDQAFGPDRLVAFAAPDARWGARVLVAADRPIDLDRVVQGLGHRVQAAARPRALLLVERWPQTESGKVNRRQLSLMWREACNGDGDAMA
ncbi:MAG: AMP-binding protein [Propionibacteriaceae bacterium]|jgi:O-succinylbenzoic acid--CoA ligase|nr:AMP-binding protein [Propionibacteriaceae bacterium]